MLANPWNDPSPEIGAFEEYAGHKHLTLKPQNCVSGPAIFLWRNLEIFHAGHHRNTDSRLSFQKWSKSVQDKRPKGRAAFLFSYHCRKETHFEPFGENPGAIYPKFLCDTHCRSSCTYIPSFVQIGSGLGSYSLKVLSLSAKLIAI